MSLRTTDYDRLLVSRPANYGSARVTSGGVARETDDWRGWAVPRSSSNTGPPVVGVAPATASSRRDELVTQIRQLDRQIKHTAAKATRRELGRQKAAAEQELHLLYRQGRPRPEGARYAPPKSSDDRQEHAHE
jgi:hypothetical protein